MANELLASTFAAYELDDLTDSYASNDLTNNGTVTFTTGKVGNAATFNGSTQYLSLAAPDLSGEALTVTCWVKLAAKTRGGIFSQYLTTGNQRAIALEYSSSLDRFNFVVSSDGTSTVSTAETVAADQLGSPSTGVWYFIQCVVTDSHVMIRVNDGDWDAETHLNGVHNSTEQFEIGRYFQSLYLNGQVDELTISKRVWTEIDLDWMYNSGSGRTFTAANAESQQAIGGTFFINDITKYASNPVLEKGSGGSWDDNGIRDPIFLIDPDGTPVQESGNYIVYYRGDDGTNNKRVGRATTSDLVSFTKYASNPVYSDGTYVSVGSVIKHSASSYEMWYRLVGGDNGIYNATSTDGLSFTKGSKILDPATDFTDCDNLIIPNAIKVGSTWYMLFEGPRASKTSVELAIWMAESSDGSTWTPSNSGNPIYEGEVGWDSYTVANPSLYELDTNKYVILYNGAPDSNLRYALSAIYSTDLTNWKRVTLEPAIPLGGATTWDDHRVEGWRIDPSTLGTSTVTGLYFGLPTSDSFADGAFGYVTAAQITTGGQTIAIGAATESDTAVAVGVVQPITVAIPPAVETDQAEPVTPVKPIRVIVDPVTETDVAEIADPVKPIVAPIGPATETDAAQLVDAIKPIIAAIGPAIETDTAVTVLESGATVVAITAATEIDIAETVTPRQATIVSIGPATETDLAEAVVPVKGIVAAIAAASETDTAETVAVIQATVAVITPATETDIAETVAIVKPIVIAIGAVSETDVAEAVLYAALEPGPPISVVIVGGETRDRRI